MLSSRFSFLGIGSSNEVNDSLGVSGSKLKPTLSLQTDKDVYRPGDSIFVTIEVGNSSGRDHENVANPSILVEKLSFEVKGIEKLDIQWFLTQKPSPGSKGRRGEHNFLDSSTPSLISSQLLSSGAKMTCNLALFLSLHQNELLHRLCVMLKATELSVSTFRLIGFFACNCYLH